MSVISVFDLKIGDAVTVTLPVHGKRDVHPEEVEPAAVGGLFKELESADCERMESKGFPLSVFQPGETLIVESVNVLTAEVLVNRERDGGRPVGYWIEAAFVTKEVGR